MSKENLFNKEAISKLKELSEKAKTCMFITNIKMSPPLNSRPMSLQECDSDGNLWFISSKESNKNMEISLDNDVHLYFMNNSEYEYLSIYGKAYIYDDQSTIDEKWSVFSNAWVEGKDDPNVSVLRVAPTDVRYWDTKNGKFLSILHYMAVAVGLGNSDNSESIEGTIDIQK